MENLMRSNSLMRIDYASVALVGRETESKILQDALKRVMFPTEKVALQRRRRSTAHSATTATTVSNTSSALSSSRSMAYSHTSRYRQNENGRHQPMYFHNSSASAPPRVYLDTTPNEVITSMLLPKQPLPLFHFSSPPSSDHFVPSSSSTSTDSLSSLSELCILVGDSGTGKSSLAKAALRPLAKQNGGWFVVGKFDLMQQNGPFAPILSCFDELCEKIYLSILSSKNYSNTNVPPIDKQKLLKSIETKFHVEDGEDGLDELMNAMPNLSKLIQAIQPERRSKTSTAIRHRKSLETASKRNSKSSVSSLAQTAASTTASRSSSFSTSSQNDHKLGEKWQLESLKISLQRLLEALAEGMLYSKPVSEIAKEQGQQASTEPLVDRGSITSVTVDIAAAAAAAAATVDSSSSDDDNEDNKNEDKAGTRSLLKLSSLMLFDSDTSKNSSDCNDSAKSTASDTTQDSSSRKEKQPKTADPANNAAADTTKTAPAFHPIVLFFDDLQWADEPCMDVLSKLILGIKGVLIVVAYREKQAEHHVSVRLQQLQHTRDLQISQIFMENLNVAALQKLISQATGRDYDLCFGLADCVHLKTQGNPFHSLQFLQLLEEESLLHYNVTKYRWEWSTERCMNETDMGDNVADLLFFKIKKLPTATQECLKIASCFGSVFDIQVIFYFLNSKNDNRDSIPLKDLKDAIKRYEEELLKPAVKENLLHVREGVEGMNYRFSHDRIQEVCYSLIPPGNERRQLHLRIGRFLLEEDDSKKLVHLNPEWRLFVTVDQLNRGALLLEDPKQRAQLVELNLKAARNVIAKSAFLPGRRYLFSGLKLLKGGDRWEKHYKSALALFTVLCEIEYGLGSSKCKLAIDEILTHGRTLRDKLPAYNCYVEWLGSQGRIKEAIKTGLDVLQKLGISRKNKKLQRMLSKKNVMEINDVEDLNPIGSSDLIFGGKSSLIATKNTVKDPTIIAALKMLTCLFPFAAFIKDRDLMTWIAHKTVKLSQKHGVHPTCTAHGLAMCGLVSDDVRQAYQFGKMALEISPHPRAMTWMYGHLSCLQRPLHDSTEPLLRAFSSAMALGDTTIASIAALYYCSVYIFSGLPLMPLIKDLEGFRDLMGQYNQTTVLQTHSVFHQLVLNLTGRSNDPLILSGSAMNEKSSTESCERQGNNMALEAMETSRMLCGLLMGDFDVAIKAADKLSKNDITVGHVGIFSEFYQGLASLQYAKRHKANKRKYLRRAKNIITNFTEYAKKENGNCHHMLMILKAEDSILKGDPMSKIKASFDSAIQSARRCGFCNHAGLANELACRYYQSVGDTDWANYYLTQSRDLYLEWNVYEKVHAMETEFDHLSIKSFGSVSRKNSSGQLRGRSRLKSQLGRTSDSIPMEGSGWRLTLPIRCSLEQSEEFF